MVKKSIHESFGIWFLLGASKKKEEKRRMKQKEEGEEDEKEEEEEKEKKEGNNWWHWSWVLAFLFPSVLKHLSDDFCSFQKFVVVTTVFLGIKNWS